MESITTVNNTTTILGGQTQHIWHANGPYQIGTEIDGGIVSPTTATISAIRIHRTTPGTSGSTTLDINRNGTTLYITNPSSKPSLAFGDAVLNATLPSDINISLGDILTLDIDGIEVEIQQTLQ